MFEYFLKNLKKKNFRLTFGGSNKSKINKHNILIIVVQIQIVPNQKPDFFKLKNVILIKTNNQS